MLKMNRSTIIIVQLRSSSAFGVDNRFELSEEKQEKNDFFSSWMINYSKLIFNVYKYIHKPSKLTIDTRNINVS